MAKKKKTFTKKAITESEKFSDYKDLINALLDDNERYTLEEVERMVKNFLNKEVQ